MSKTTWSDKLMVVGYVVSIGTFIYKIKFPDKINNFILWLFLVAISSSIIYAWDNKKFFRNDRPRLIAPIVLLLISLAGMFWRD